jgi:hypothetical protein
MRILFLIIPMVCFLLLEGCKTKQKKCLSLSDDFGSGEIRAAGCFINKLEEGRWSFYDSDGAVIEKGTFDRGTRSGLWTYPENPYDTTINWARYEKPGLNLVTNIPEQLKMVEDSLRYSKFKNDISKIPFILVIAVQDTPPMFTTIDEYHQVGISELKETGDLYSLDQQVYFTQDGKVFINKYEIFKPGSDTFKILNGYKVVDSTKIFEITIRYTPSTAITAQTVFLSIVSNCFYKGRKFIDFFERGIRIKNNHLPEKN